MHRLVCGLAVAACALAPGLAPALQPAADSTAAPAPAAQAPTAPPPTRATFTPRAVPDSISTVVDSTLLTKLRQGGYIVWLRHGLTNWDERDTQKSDFSSRANQRNLSAAGKVQMAELGKAFAALKLPIQNVLASPMWRARDSAELAFGAYDTAATLFFKGPQFRDARVKMLSTPPDSGKDLIFVGHQDPLLPIVPGLKREQVREGDALVIQPLGEGKFRVVVQVTPADWARLAGLPAPAAAAGAPPATSAPADTTHRH